MDNLNILGLKVRLVAMFGITLCGVLSHAQELSERDAAGLIRNSIASQLIRNLGDAIDKRDYADVSVRFALIHTVINSTVEGLSSGASYDVQDRVSRAKERCISEMMQYVNNQYSLFEMYALKDSLRLHDPLIARVKLLCKGKFFETHRQNGVTRQCGELKIFIPAEELTLCEVSQKERVFENPLDRCKWYKTIGIVSAAVAVVTIGLLWWNASSFHVS